MADRVKRRYRGRTYTAKSSRPGRKTVKVRAYCRRGGKKLESSWQTAMRHAKEWGF